MSSVTRRFVVAVSMSTLVSAAGPALAHDGEMGKRAAEDLQRSSEEAIRAPDEQLAPSEVTPSTSREVAKPGPETRTGMTADPGAWPPRSKQEGTLQSGNYRVNNNTVDGEFGP